MMPKESSTPTLPRLDAYGLRRGVEYLTDKDPKLAAVVDKHGPPPLWARPPGLETLLRIILEQQVSLASGAAVFKRLENHLGRVTSKAILNCGEESLRGIGITRQKASYCMAVAGSIADGSLDLKRVASSEDDIASHELRQVKGIGHWTADCYLLMALGRPDVWPAGDVALHTAIRHLDDLDERPSTDKATEIALRWRPWRAVAARILWLGYLEGSLRSPAASRLRAGKE